MRDSVIRDNEGELGGGIKNDADVTTHLLENGIALPNGAGYGLSPYFRVSFASALANLDEACKRLALAAERVA